MRRRMSLLIGLSLFFSSFAFSQYDITQDHLKKHVTFLCADALEGRLTGSPGEEKAAQYIANQFQQLGLTPAGDHGSFFQTFDFTAGAALGKNNTLSISDAHHPAKTLRLGLEWMPLSFSDNTRFETDSFIFAGYGITTPTQTYDSYRHLNVKNKWVLVFLGTPNTLSALEKKQIWPYTTLRYKAFNAKEHGANGIIFVNEQTHKDTLIPFASDTTAIGAGIVALTVKHEALKSFFDTHQPIHLSGQTQIQAVKQTGHTVLAKLTLSQTENAMILIGAHLDHLGHGKSGGSRAHDNESEQIHPGADDNASGVASLLETAATLQDLKKQGKLNGQHDILFAAWSGEELGVLGSTHFINQLTQQTHLKSLHLTLNAAINLDMVGHLRKGLVLQGLGSSPEWKPILDILKHHTNLTLITQNDPYLPTDSTPFYVHGVPTLNFFTGAHDDYHTPRDTPDTLNYAGIKTLSEFLVDLIITLEAQPKPISYQAVQKPKENSEPLRHIYLGTIPDYTSADIAGVKLSGVAKNSPAAAAGLQPNDILIQLAGKNIQDIYDYTFILNTLTVGKKTPLLVLRGQNKVSLTVIARYRE